MSRLRVARSVLLTTRDTVLGLLAFTIIAMAVLAKSSSGTPPALSDFLSLSNNSGIFAVSGQSMAAPPINVSARQVRDAANTVRTAVPVTPTGANATFKRTGKTTAVILLAIIFTAVIAFMLTFLRHLQRVKFYVVPSQRREIWA